MERSEWTTGEVRMMRDNACLGAAALASLLGRSRGSVEQAAHRHRISLRRFGCLRGLVLGQPRGVALRGDIRADLVADPHLAEIIARRLAADANADLCPQCAARPIRVRSTGLCLVCHLTELETHLRETEAEKAARQSYDAVKSGAYRERQNGDRVPA